MCVCFVLGVQSGIGTVRGWESVNQVQFADGARGDHIRAGTGYFWQIAIRDNDIYLFCVCICKYWYG